MSTLPRKTHPDLIVGFETSDDAGVFRVGPTLALVQTVDFITPVVDDPFFFGRIAAANALSDVWAMGGQPLTAMNILCFPADTLPLEIAREILRGGMEVIEESGAVLVGGHSVKDAELKYGLSVTGTVHPERVVTNRGALPGDRVILTKGIGTGLLATAIKGRVARPGTEQALVCSAGALNRQAAEAMAGHGAHACTDITGFGLGGHLLEVARASRVVIRLSARDLPLLAFAAEYAREGLAPVGTQANRAYFRDFYEIGPGVEGPVEELVFDPQTSGGLAIFLPAAEAEGCLADLHRRGVAEARIVGRVIAPHSCGRLVIAP